MEENLRTSKLAIYPKSLVKVCLFKLFFLFFIIMLANEKQTINMIDYTKNDFVFDKHSFKEFYYLNNNIDICINAYIFRKLKDYTELIKHLIEVNNKCIEIKINKQMDPTFDIYVNLQNIKVKNADFEFLKVLIPFLENSYPDALSKLYFHKIPFMFKTTYPFIRLMIDKDTRKKIFFIKKNKNITEDKLDDIFN